MDILKVLVIIAFIIVTICSIKIHPSIHQPMIIEDADFKLTRISDTLNSDNIASTTVSTKTDPVKISQQEASQSKPQVVEVGQRELVSPQGGNQQQTKYVQMENPSQQSSRIKNIKPKQQSEQQSKPNEEMSDMEMLQQILKGVQEQTQPTKQHSAQQVSPNTNKNFKNHYMSEQEEIIAWSKWRSGIQNQIMKDSNIDYAPLGTLFIFTFVVDKYGNVSNVKVDCSNRNYMDVARNNVKPAILRLQKKPILNFPRGSQRTTTIVNGAFLIGTQERFSTPNDFSDYERVKYYE